MIRPIMRNQLFLAMPSEAATIEDAPVGQDLLDTLEAHAHECVGMAANMIGVRKRIIVFDDNGTAKPHVQSRNRACLKRVFHRGGVPVACGAAAMSAVSQDSRVVSMNRSKPARKASVALRRR